MADLDKLKHNPDFQRHTYRALAASAVFLIAAGTVIFSLLEDWSIVDSFYFSVVAATTVGFGDITPDTDAAKLFTVVYIVFGISIMLARIEMSRRAVPDARIEVEPARST